MTNLTLRLAACSLPAGKYTPGAPLDGNEDNFYIADDLSATSATGSFRSDTPMELSPCGCLMMVADGMGGMNAGEVASALAVDTVSELFAPGKITPEMAADSRSRQQLLEAAIVEADRRIKADAAANPSHAGMGSTIILVWIVGDRLTISWCGDSRAYRFNPRRGLEPLSSDHSYVQELVDQGILTYDDTFEHPQGNIVTRSLGDPEKPALPESREYLLYTGDIILLCSDGLSGVLRDHLTPDPQNGGYYPGENIEDIMAASTAPIPAGNPSLPATLPPLSGCITSLMQAAERADWYDNVTILLCQILSGAPEAPLLQRRPEPAPAPQTPPAAAVPTVESAPRQTLQQSSPPAPETPAKSRTGRRKMILCAVGAFLIAAVCTALWFSGVLDRRTGSDALADGSDSVHVVEGIVEGEAVVLGEDIPEYGETAAEDAATSAQLSSPNKTPGSEAKEKAETRTRLLKSLEKYKGLLTEEGETAYSELHSEISSSEKYAPDNWAKRIAELKKHLKESPEAGSENPAPGKGGQQSQEVSDKKEPDAPALHDMGTPGKK